MRSCIRSQEIFKSPRVAVESLIAKGFKPQRTVVLGFGFDEETGGKEVRFLEIRYNFLTFLQGALAIGEYLLEKYGKDSFSMIVDEGGKHI